LKFDPAIQEISMADESGREIIRVSRLSAYTDADLRSLGREERFRQAFHGRVFISPVYHAPTAEPFITLAVPIEFTATEIKGVIVAEVSLKKLWNSISDIKVGKSGQVFVVDHKGNLIAHPDYSKVLSGTNLAALHEVKEFLHYSDADPGFGEPVVGQNGKQVMSSYARVAQPDWAVVVEEPVETSLGEVKQIQALAIAFFMLTLGGTLGISYYFAARVTRQVRQLEEGAKLIANGNLAYKLNIHSGDEIETLANQFNRMATELSASYQGLENKMTERTGDLSSLYAALAPLASSDSAQLSQQIVDRLKEATHADAALIRILDEEKKSFLYRAQAGFPAGYLESTRILEKDSAIGRTFWTETPIIAGDIETDSRLKGKKQLEAGFKSSAFLPFRIAGELRGMIHLASRTVGHFSADKTDHLMAIARQMGVAMENQELFRKAEQRAQEQVVLRTLAMATGQLLEIGKLFDIALEKTVEVTGRPRITIRLKDPFTGKINLVAHRGLSEAEVEKLSLKTEHAAVEQVFTSGNVLIIDGTGQNRSPDLLEATRSAAWIPIKAESRVVGVLGISENQSRTFSPGEVRLLEAIGSIIGVAIENARLFTEINRQAVELAKANKGKDEFLSILSHELRSPLNVVLGYSQVLKEGMLGEIVPEQEKALEKIMAAAKGQLAMVNSILQVTKIEAGAASVTREETNVAELLDEIRSGYDLPINKEVALRWEYGTELPVLKTDGEKLKHIVQNLVGNAIKFTERGNVTVCARYIPDSRVLELTVSDTGVGIQPQALATIFEMFKQADSSDTRRHEGLGIGLFIVRKFTEMLGGSIDVKSEPENGSCFTVTLPADGTGWKDSRPDSRSHVLAPPIPSPHSL
jgi:signal transduction histidine kinase/HAMP domain-containing protein